MCTINVIFTGYYLRVQNCCFYPTWNFRHYHLGGFISIETWRKSTLKGGTRKKAESTGKSLWTRNRQGEIAWCVQRTANSLILFECRVKRGIGEEAGQADRIKSLQFGPQTSTPLQIQLLSSPGSPPWHIILLQDGLGPHCYGSLIVWTSRSSYS